MSELSAFDLTKPEAIKQIERTINAQHKVVFNCGGESWLTSDLQHAQKALFISGNKEQRHNRLGLAYCGTAGKDVILIDVLADQDRGRHKYKALTMSDVVKIGADEFDGLVYAALVEQTEKYQRLNKKSNKPSEIDNKVAELTTEVDMAVLANEEPHITKHGPTS